ncbi:MAG TPA: hypothetical protein VH350_18075 [Candidatus Sulfotelmatobacter sp.]|jgi:hypothetical protein|nr:hypothetical protein [Candidatus Sulfotelmatobacter sp.]
MLRLREKDRFALLPAPLSMTNSFSAPLNMTNLFLLRAGWQVTFQTFVRASGYSWANLELAAM